MSRFCWGTNKPERPLRVIAATPAPEGQLPNIIAIALPDGECAIYQKQKKVENHAQTIPALASDDPAE